MTTAEALPNGLNRPDRRVTLQRPLAYWIIEFGRLLVRLVIAKTKMLSPKGKSAESAAILDALEDCINELHSEWKTLLELFAAGEETSKLLSDTASALFDTLYRVLIRDILLSVARLTDPLKTAGKRQSS